MLRKSRDSSADSSSLEVEVEDEVAQLEVTVPSRGQIYPRNQTLNREQRFDLAGRTKPEKEAESYGKERGHGQEDGDYQEGVS